MSVKWSEENDSNIRRVEVLWPIFFFSRHDFPFLNCRYFTYGFIGRSSSCVIPVPFAAELKESVLPRCLCILDANYFLVCRLCNYNRILGKKPQWFSVLLYKRDKSSIYLNRVRGRTTDAIGKPVRVNSLGSVSLLAKTKYRWKFNLCCSWWELERKFILTSLSLLWWVVKSW